MYTHLEEELVSARLYLFQPFHDWKPVLETYADTADLVHMPRSVASGQGLHCLLSEISMQDT